MLNKEERDQRWANGQGYNRYITGELNSFRKQAWKQMICRHFQKELSLDVLDIGTGPGFFACILSEEGHRVTGIDASEGMLGCARNNAKLLGVGPEFLEMDVNHLDFPDNRFDVLVTRNVTWTLEFPENVYTEFKRILRPNGLLLIYDANWHMHYFDEELMKRVRKREQNHFERYGKKEIVCNDDTDYFGCLPLSNTLRPQWDMKVLGRLGFTVSVEENVGKDVYEDWEKQLYGESPLFEICAVNNEMSLEKTRIQNYWQTRSSTFGFTKSAEEIKGWQERISTYLPEGRLKILDAGTGTGFLAIATALMGHDVTGIDMCSNMIQKAKENAVKHKTDITFFCTDAGEMPFEDETFDVVISRNLIWALMNPEEVLVQWKRILKPGGLLMYFDGNHYTYLFNEEDRKAREKYVSITGNAHRGDPGGVNYEEMDDAALALPLSKLDRPHEWDDKVLPKMGYNIIAKEVERPQELLSQEIAEGYYTVFLIVAQKSHNNTN